MEDIDTFFRRPNTSSTKRKLEVSHDPSTFYKSARTSTNGDAKGQRHARVEDEDEPTPDDDVEAGPALPPDDDEDEQDDEEGRFFGGGVDSGTAAAIDYVDKRDAENEEDMDEAFDVSWLRKKALNFEKRISKNGELRAKYEDDPAKFMSSEADLDDDIKALSILSEHPDLYPEFANLGCMASLVSLLAHENTDIAIDAIQVISELTDEEVSATQEQWDALVSAALEADLLSLLVSNFSRFDETNEADRDGLYNSLGVLENLASQPELARRIGAEDTILPWLLQRIQIKETPITQNTQYAAEVLAILLQSSSSNRSLFLTRQAATNGKGKESHDPTSNPLDPLLTLLSQYRRTDSLKDSTEEEFVENLFDAITVLLDSPESKQYFVDAEGVELMLIMIREGRLAKSRALRALDHACGGVDGSIVCAQVVESQGLRTLFTMLMKDSKKAKDGREEMSRETQEHLLGILASLLRALPADSAPRIRTLAKFVEKNYEKIGRLISLRRKHAARLADVDRQIAEEMPERSAEEKEERDFDDLSRRLDSGLFILQTIDIILAWLVAEDAGAKREIVQRLAETDASLEDVKKILREQVDGIENSEDDLIASSQKEMLTALLAFL